MANMVLAANYSCHVYGYALHVGQVTVHAAPAPSLADGSLLIAWLSRRPQWWMQRQSRCQIQSSRLLHPRYELADDMEAERLTHEVWLSHRRAQGTASVRTRHGLRITSRQCDWQQADLVMIRICEWISKVVFGGVVCERVCGQMGQQSRRVECRQPNPTMSTQQSRTVTGHAGMVSS